MLRYEIIRTDNVEEVALVLGQKILLRALKGLAVNTADQIAKCYYSSLFGSRRPIKISDSTFFRIVSKRTSSKYRRSDCKMLLFITFWIT